MQKAEVERLLMKPTARKRLGKYVLLGRLGHGGMGKIYLAFAPGPGGIEKLLVIKRLHSHLTSDPVLVANFLDEARLSMVLQHPNIVHTYDVGEVDGRYFIVMEYIDGQNLGVLLRTAKRSGNYPDGTLWSGLFLGVLDALHAAHTARDARGRELHIIHRDVSPQNVLVTYDGQAQLVDFGIAKAALRISETDAGVLKGKYSYMSPEQCQSQPLDPRSDVFSAGIVFWEMLAGRRLYKADSIVKSVERIMTEPPIPPQRVNPECDAELSKVVLKALQKKPNDRYASAEEFRYAIDEALHRGRHFRQTEVRDLMDRLFKDVRDRQQKLLEACLSGVAEAVDDDNVRGSLNDSDSHVPVGQGASDSESDLLVPNLSAGYEHETTTPSSARRSPLVTQEEEGDDQKRPIIAPIGSAESGAPTADRLAPPSSTVTASSRSGSSGLLVAAGAAIGIVVLLVGAIALGVASGRLGSDDTDVEVRAAEVTGELGSPSTGQDDDDDQREAKQPDGEGANATGAPDGDVVPDGQDRAGDDASAQTQGPASDDGVPAQGSDDGEVAAGDDADRVAKDDDRRTRSRSRSSRARRSGGNDRNDKKLDDDTVLKAADTNTSADRPAVIEPAGATLTLETVPWSVVYLGKKRLGETPLVNVPIPAGDLELLLVNPDKDIRQPYFLKAEPGKTYRKRLALE